MPTVAAVAPEINSTELVTYRNKNASSMLVGTTTEFLSVRSFDVAKGHFLTNLDLKRNNHVVALGTDLAKKLFGNSDPIGQQLRIKNVSFLVIGVMQPKGSVMGTNYDDTAYVPITTMANRIVGQTSPYGIDVTLISVSAKDSASVRAAQFQITNLLRLRHQIALEDDFTVQNQKNVLDIVSAVTGALTIMLAAIALDLAVGGRYWHYEHHARFSNRAHAGNWAAKGDWCLPARHSNSVHDRSRHFVGSWRLDRHTNRH